MVSTKTTKKKGSSSKPSSSASSSSCKYKKVGETKDSARKCVYVKTGTATGSDKNSKYYTASIVDGKRKYKVYNGEVKRVQKGGVVTPLANKSNALFVPQGGVTTPPAKQSNALLFVPRPPSAPPPSITSRPRLFKSTTQVQSVSNSRNASAKSGAQNKQLSRATGFNYTNEELKLMNDIQNAISLQGIKNIKRLLEPRAQSKFSANNEALMNNVMKENAQYNKDINKLQQQFILKYHGEKLNIIDYQLILMGLERHINKNYIGGNIHTLLLSEYIKPSLLTVEEYLNGYGDEKTLISNLHTYASNFNSKHEKYKDQDFDHYTNYYLNIIANPDSKKEVNYNNVHN